MMDVRWCSELPLSCVLRILNDVSHSELGLLSVVYSQYCI